eukprot:m.197228 g.197228  ORF g.197228 m.197228 type:complete len:145 (+) comp53761_c0_seq1:928-1362(+)
MQPSLRLKGNEIRKLARLALKNALKERQSNSLQAAEASNKLDQELTTLYLKRLAYKRKLKVAAVPGLKRDFGVTLLCFLVQTPPEHLQEAIRTALERRSQLQHPEAGAVRDDGKAAPPAQMKKPRPKPSVPKKPTPSSSSQPSP